MSEPIVIWVDGVPKGQPRPRAFAFHGKARVYDPGTAEGWKSSVAFAAKPFLPASPIDCPVRLWIQFNMPRPKSHLRKDGSLKPSAPLNFTAKPDADNLAKAVMDALTTIGFWKDDAQITTLTAVKSYAIGKPGASIQIQPINQA